MAKPDDTNRNGSKLAMVVATALGAAIGGGGGLYLFVGTPIGQQVTRPDPFTGTQATTLESRLDTVERRVDQLPPRELELAIALLRSEIEHLNDRVNNLEREH